VSSSKQGWTSRASWSWLALWCVAVGVAIAERPLLPIDETRYLSVAWEMWRRGDWVVPYLNGAPYSDKPPLLFWGILAGWRAFGVNEWWPRLLAPLAGLLSAILVAHLARRLSPDRVDAADRAIPFLSGLLWTSYSTLVLFDTLLTLCVLVALCGVVEAWRGRVGYGWLACGAGIGLGVLTKGPVVLVHVLPVALLAPWWGFGRPVPWRRAWYCGLIAAVALGAAIGLAWALSAAARGGAAYRAAILWDQTAGRVTHAFAHNRPWWWYLPLLLLILFPWSVWPPLWRSLAASHRGPPELPMRFALAVVVPGLLAFSLISGKQVHYLMPLLPAFAILAGHTSRRTPEVTRSWDTLLPASLLAIGGGLLLATRYLRGISGAPEWAAGVSPWWGLILLIGGALVGLPRRAHQQIITLSLLTPALLILVHLAGREVIGWTQDLRPAAEFLRKAESAHQPIAFVGHYAGQFHFLGRLERPFDEITSEGISRWASDHPSGLVVRTSPAATGTPGVVYLQHYRDGTLEISKATSVVAR
jgi:4-amino-4-deoxy-L-arabinose transferase-like glycosyltransferase